MLQHGAPGHLPRAWSTSSSPSPLPGGSAGLFLLHLLKHLIPETLPSVTDGLSLGQQWVPLGASWHVRHGGSSWHLLTESSPAVPLLSNCCHTNSAQAWNTERRGKLSTIENQLGGPAGLTELGQRTIPVTEEKDPGWTQGQHGQSLVGAERQSCACTSTPCSPSSTAGEGTRPQLLCSLCMLLRTPQWEGPKKGAQRTSGRNREQPPASPGTHSHKHTHTPPSWTCAPLATHTPAMPAPTTAGHAHWLGRDDVHAQPWARTLDGPKHLTGGSLTAGVYGHAHPWVTHNPGSWTDTREHLARAQRHQGCAHPTTRSPQLH